MTLKDKYNTLITTGKIKDDPSQREVLKILEQLSTKLTKYFSKNKTVLQKIITFQAKDHNICGLYIYGDVGRGKSMLLDLFFEHIEIKKKKRVHFHAFMLDVHARLHKWRKKNRDNNEAKDPIPLIAKDIAKKSLILCFDELQVSDIADAMILGRLFTELFKNGVVIVATSNRHPDELYKDGLQRERFLPFIELFKEKLAITCLNANEDYRFSHLQSLECVYYQPLDRKSHKFINNAFLSLTNGAKPIITKLDISGRKLILKKTHGDVAWVHFSDLCEQPLGAADYIEIAREFGTLLLEGIPQMDRENRNEAKRFVILIDELYEYKVKLIATAAAQPDKLYVAGDGSFEFKRTASRLIEMQTEQYLATKHL